MMKNQIVWCDIPVVDLDRAMKSYGSVLKAEVTKQSFPGGSFGLLPHEDQQSSGGSLVAGPDFKPSAIGPMIYLNCNGHLDESVQAVVDRGVKAIEPKHQIGPHGLRAVVLDSEGNRIGVHSY